MNIYLSKKIFDTDYIPVVSTFTNLYQIFKEALNQKDSGSSNATSGSFPVRVTMINKTTLEKALLLIPVVGNIIVYYYRSKTTIDTIKKTVETGKPLYWSYSHDLWSNSSQLSLKFLEEEKRPLEELLSKLKSSTTTKSDSVYQNLSSSLETLCQYVNQQLIRINLLKTQVEESIVSHQHDIFDQFLDQVPLLDGSQLLKKAVEVSNTTVIKKLREKFSLQLEDEDRQFCAQRFYDSYSLFLACHTQFTPKTTETRQSMTTCSSTKKFSDIENDPFFLFCFTNISNLYKEFDIDTQKEIASIFYCFFAIHTNNLQLFKKYFTKVTTTVPLDRMYSKLCLALLKSSAFHETGEILEEILKYLHYESWETTLEDLLKIHPFNKESIKKIIERNRADRKIHKPN